MTEEDKIKELEKRIDDLEKGRRKRLRISKKVLTVMTAIIIVVIVLVGIIGGIEFYGPVSSKVTVTYQIDYSQYTTGPFYISQNSAKFYTDGYYGWATSIVLNANFSCAKEVTLNENDFYIISDGHPLPNIDLTLLANSNSTFTLVRSFDYSGYGYAMQFNFVVEGNQTTFQFAYNGTANVDVIGPDNQ